MQSDIEEMKGNLAKMTGWLEAETDESEREALEFAQQSMIRRFTSLGQIREYFVKRLDALGLFRGLFCCKSLSQSERGVFVYHDAS